MDDEMTILHTNSTWDFVLLSNQSEFSVDIYMVKVGFNG